MKKKSLVALIMALFVVATCLVGCGGAKSLSEKDVTVSDIGFNGIEGYSAIGDHSWKSDTNLGTINMTVTDKDSDSFNDLKQEDLEKELVDQMSNSLTGMGATDVKTTTGNFEKIKIPKDGFNAIKFDATVSCKMAGQDFKMYLVEYMIDADKTYIFAMATDDNGKKDLETFQSTMENLDIKYKEN